MSGRQQLHRRATRNNPISESAQLDFIGFVLAQPQGPRLVHNRNAPGLTTKLRDEAGVTFVFVHLSSRSPSRLLKNNFQEGSAEAACRKRVQSDDSVQTPPTLSAKAKNKIRLSRQTLREPPTGC